jgi:hypothetical protein
VLSFFSPWLRPRREDAIGNRYQDQREERREAEATDNHLDESQTRFRAGSVREDQRQCTENSSRDRHHDGLEPRARGFANSSIHNRALVAPDVREFNDQNSVLGHDVNEANLAVDVERAAGEFDCERRGCKIERHRKENYERARDALKLGRLQKERDL